MFRDLTIVSNLIWGYKHMMVAILSKIRALDEGCICVFTDFFMRRYGLFLILDCTDTISIFTLRILLLVIVIIAKMHCCLCK